MESFKRTLILGVKWTTMSAIVKSVVKLLQVAILTRFLTKADFGTIAIALMFIGFTELFLDMGISTAILHRQNISKQQFSSLFWLNIYTGLTLTIILWISIPYIAQWYSDDSLVPVLRYLSLNLLFSAIGRQHLTIQQKKMKFKLLANVELCTFLGTFVIAVCLAYLGLGVYSLVYSTLFSVIFPNFTFCAYGLFTDRNISFHFCINDTKPFLKIGVFQICSSIFDYLSREFDILIISATLGKETLGVYSLCKRVVSTLFSTINPILTRVLTPLFAQIQDDMERLRQNYLRVINILATTNYPIYVLMAVLSSAILYNLYGENYVEGQYVLSFVSIAYGLLSIANPVGTLQAALGRTDLGLYWTVFRILTNTVFLYLGALISVNFMAFAFLTYNVFTIFPFWFMQYRPMLQISFWQYLHCQIYQFLIAIISAVPFAILFYQNHNIIISIIEGVVYLCVYILLTLSLNKNNYVFGLVREYIAKNRNSHE